MKAETIETLKQASDAAELNLLETIKKFVESRQILAVAQLEHNRLYQKWLDDGVLFSDKRGEYLRARQIVKE